MVDTDINLEVRELETLINDLDGVSDVVIVNVNKSDEDVLLTAFVETDDDDDSTITQQLIIQHCLEKSTRGRAPSTVLFCKIPRTPSGKVARMVLLEQLAG